LRHGALLGPVESAAVLAEGRSLLHLGQIDVLRHAGIGVDDGLTHERARAPSVL